MSGRVLYFENNKKARVSDMCKILQKIKGKSAIELLQEYNIPLTPPIDISTLLDKIGISVIAKDFSYVEEQSELPKDSILGAAISKGDNLAIFYREKDSYERFIFTIAHELGHCCMHAENLKISHIELRTKGEEYDAHENEADIFARELLIPEELLMKNYNKFIIPSLNALSQIFGVSTGTMAARLDQLKLHYFKDVELSEE